MDDIKLPDELREKYKLLKDNIRGLGSLAVGFSGGVDSSLLLAVAQDVLSDNVIAVTSVHVSVPERELNEAKEFCSERNIRHFISRIDPMEDEEFRYNGPERCYFCKRRIFADIKRIAKENGMEFVAEGSNMDDNSDYRPGHRAVEELSVRSPLREAGLYKQDIRLISKAMGLLTWRKPAYACLASRFVYGEEITEEKLHMIDMAEQFLIDQGFHEERVRLHGNLARIEVPARDIERLASDKVREAVYKRFKEIGFLYVTIDALGYRQGSMNKTI